MMEELRALMKGSAEPSGLLTSGKYIRANWHADQKLLDRANVKGVNVTLPRADAAAHIMPRISADDFEYMTSILGDTRDEEVMYWLSRWCEQGSDRWKNYMAFHTAQRVQREDGKGDMHVVPNPCSKFPAPVEIAHSKARSSEKKKVYTLVQIFTDTYITDKYQLSPKVLRDMQLLAIQRPQDAAASLQVLIQRQSPGIKIVVEAGGYARTKQQAAATIRNLAQGKVGQISYESEIVGEYIVVYGSGQARNSGWFVRGPLEHAKSVTQVVQLAEYAGLQATMFLLSMETLILKIDIHDGEFYVSPTIISHARHIDVDLPSDSDSKALASLSDEALSLLDKLVVNVNPIRDQQGELVATAVRTGDRTVVMNGHVRGDSKLYVDDTRVDADGIPLSEDLWMHKVSGRYEPWQLRVASPGEYAAVLYHNGDKVLLSAPLKISSVTGTYVLSERNSAITKGMSGGALVALTDLALLGIHSGSASQHLLACTYTDAMSMDMLELMYKDDCDESVQEPPADIYVQLRSRGVQNVFVRTVSHLTSLHSLKKEHIGSAVVVGSKTFSVCEPGTVLGDAGPLTFVSEPTLYSVADSVTSAIPTEPLLHRLPRVAEKVVVVAKKGGEIYHSNETIVRQVSAHGKNFFLSSLDSSLCSLVGGMVVSLQDGAFLGLYLRDAEDVAVADRKLSMCVTVPKLTAMDIVDLSVKDALVRKFPMLRLSLWPNQEYQLPFSGNFSDEVAALAALARLQATLVLQSRLHSLQVPQEQWQSYVEQAVSDVRLANIMRSLQLDGLVSSSKTDAELASALWCFMALVNEHETQENYQLIVSMLGFVPDRDNLNGPRADYSKLMRRTSEFGIRYVDAFGNAKVLTPVDAVFPLELTEFD